MQQQDSIQMFRWWPTVSLLLHLMAPALLDSGSTVFFFYFRVTSSSSKTSTVSAASYNLWCSMGALCNQLVLFVISPTNSTHKEISVTAVIVSRVTSNLPLKSMQLDAKWKHLSDIQLADPDFGSPGKIDLLLGVDIFITVLLNGGGFIQLDDPQQP